MNKQRRMISSRRPILSYTVQLVILNVCTKFQNSSCSGSWEIFDKNLIGEKLERKKNWTNKGNDKLEQADSLLHCTTSHTQRFYQISDTLPVEVLRYLLQKINWRERKNGQIKGMISSRRLILSYTVQLVIPNVCTKFQNSSCSGSWEIFDKNLIGEKLERKKNWTNKGNDKLDQILSYTADSLLHGTTSHTQRFYQISDTLTVEVFEISLTEN